MAHPYRRIAFAALAPLFSLLCNCTPDTPDTELVWNANESVRTTPIPRTASTYVYQDGASVKPTPRPTETAYVPAARCSCDSQVTASSLPPAASSGPVSFEWPVTGSIISGFGSDQSGQRNDGINIAAKLGEPIHAAASGDVIYSGDELKGYGNLVLIKHSDGYVTAYAHAERILVAKGDYVTKGQVIGYAGQTGDVTTPQVHFEIRRGTEPVNPRPLLVASR